MKKAFLYIGFACLGLLMGAVSSIAQTNTKVMANPQAKKNAPENNVGMTPRPAGVQRTVTQDGGNAKLSAAPQDNSKQGTAQPAQPANQQKSTQTGSEPKKMNESVGGKAK